VGEAEREGSVRKFSAAASNAESPSARREVGWRVTALPFLDCMLTDRWLDPAVEDPARRARSAA